MLDMTNMQFNHDVFYVFGTRICHMRAEYVQTCLSLATRKGNIITKMIITRLIHDVRDKFLTSPDAY